MSPDDQSRPDDERTLTTPAAAKLLDVSQQTLRRYADQGLLCSKRVTVRGHRRITESSVRDLAAVLAMPFGAERDSALEALRRRNLGLPPEDGPAAPGPAAEPVEGE